MSVQHVNAEQWDQMMAAFERADQWRADQIPDEAAALNVMMECWKRLKEMGWRESMYCPRDGAPVEFIEAGSTGIHKGWRDDTYFWIDDGDQWPSKTGPILFRLKQEKQP